MKPREVDGEQMGPVWLDSEFWLRLYETLFLVFTLLYVLASLIVVFRLIYSCLQQSSTYGGSDFNSCF